VPPDAPVPVPGAQLGSRGASALGEQSVVLLLFDPLLVRPGDCEVVPASARLLLLDVLSLDDAEPAAPLPALSPLIDEHPAARAAIATATIVIPDCVFMHSPLNSRDGLSSSQRISTAGVPSLDR
jgi:hypothetical protein